MQSISTKTNYLQSDIISINKLDSVISNDINRLFIDDILSICNECREFISRWFSSGTRELLKLKLLGEHSKYLKHPLTYSDDLNYHFNHKIVAEINIKKKKFLTLLTIVPNL